MGHFTDALRLPSAKFSEHGDFVEGKVLKMETANVPLFDDKGRIVPDKYKTTEDGTVITQVDVTIEQSDSTRVVLHTEGAIFYAIGLALATQDFEDLEVGDTLKVTFVSTAEPTAKNRNGAKQYTATVTR